MVFGPETARRIVANTRRGEALPLDRTGKDVPSATLNRYYREFELTEELSGGKGAEADVKWLVWNDASQEMVDSGKTGEVCDHLGAAWGIKGDRGEARFLGGKWVVSRNPGQGIYPGSLAGDTTSSPANVTISLGGEDSTVSCTLRKTPPSGEKYASGTGCYVGNCRGAWEIVAMLDCPVED